ncbi:protein FAM162B-like [Lissotriton helveticus]
MLGFRLITYKALVTRALNTASQQWPQGRQAQHVLKTARRTFCHEANPTEGKKGHLQPTYSGDSTYRNERRPTTFDKKILLWSGRFKKEEDIPEMVSYELMNAAQSKMRVMTCYVMIALTIVGCVVMVISGKDAVKKENTLMKRNMEKRAKWKAEKELEENTLKEQ